MAELGEKHECFDCGAKFYDLGRTKKICPRCGVDQKQARKDETEKPQPKVEKAPQAAEPDVDEEKELDEDEDLDDGEDLDAEDELGEVEVEDGAAGVDLVDLDEDDEDL